MTWHQWQAEYPTERRIGRCSSRARRERLVAPGVPVHRVRRVLAQVRRRLGGEAVGAAGRMHSRALKPRHRSVRNGAARWPLGQPGFAGVCRDGGAASQPPARYRHVPERSHCVLVATVVLAGLGRLHHHHQQQQGHAVRQHLEGSRRRAARGEPGGQGRGDGDVQAGEHAEEG